MRWLIAGYASGLAVLVGVVAAGAVVLYDETGPDGRVETLAAPYSYDVVSWELRHFPEKWLFKVGGVFRSNDKGQADEDVLERYFNLTSRMRATDADSPDYAAMEEERAWLENSVEDIIEGRMTSVLEAEGLTMGPPPFTDLGLVFPPVDFEFDAPPRVLVISPRAEIREDASYLLEPTVNREAAQRIEADAEAAGDVSALVAPTGGVATYPSVEFNLTPYDNLVDTAFHEWIHQYLAFYPLGSRYFRNSDLRTLNESVANIAGEELAKRYFERYGHLDLHENETPAPSPSPSLAPSPSPSAPAFDFTKEMQQLRKDVEALLKAGQVEEAEALMNEKRDYFEENGVFIRRLNQAYFAHYGYYANTAASIDPIGPKLQTLLEREGSPGAFVRAARSITSREELDRVVAETGG